MAAALRLHDDPKYDAWNKYMKRMSSKLMIMESMRGGGAARPPRRLSAALLPHHEAVEQRGEPVRLLQLAQKFHVHVDKRRMKWNLDCIMLFM